LADQADKPTWAVATVARESPEVIRRFVSWHLDMGASEIVIYCDDPDDPNIDLVAHLAQVKCVRCTPEFWKSVGMDPDRMFVKRQNRAIQHAYKNCSFDWLLVCDADELLYMSRGQRLEEVLLAQPMQVRSVIFRPAERVVVDGDEANTWYRLPMGRKMLVRALGDELAGALAQRGGFVGHSIGKSVVRTGVSGLSLRQHFGELRGGEKVIDKVFDWDRGGAILHLMNNSFSGWNRKLRVRIVGSSMTRGLRAILTRVFEAGDETAIREYFRKLYHVSAEIAPVMKRRGALVQAKIDPDHAVARYFPESAP